MQARNHYKYELKKGNKIVYFGITKDPERRFAEHDRDKRFGHMNIVGNATTKEGAMNWERRKLIQYARHHGGILPSKNKRISGF
jgi:predicted GIY-YIG superfamily endonuclease